MKSAERKWNLPICAACILFMLTMLSFSLVSVLYAKYHFAAEKEDKASVATFDIEAEGTLLHLINTKIVPGGEQDEYFHIVNKSEVAIRYTLTVKNETSNLPLSLCLKKIGTAEEFHLSGGTIELNKDMVPGETEDDYVLEIRWPVDENNPDSNLAYMGMLDYFTVTVDVVQAD